jgi:hypothetical protein
MYAIMILVCALSTPAKDCQKDTATQIIHAPDEQDSLTSCMLYAIRYAAESNLVTKGYYPKVFCIAPSNIGRETTG